MKIIIRRTSATAVKMREHLFRGVPSVGDVSPILLRHPTTPLQGKDRESRSRMPPEGHSGRSNRFP
jgi:hypothetical protein